MGVRAFRKVLQNQFRGLCIKKTAECAKNLNFARYLLTPFVLRRPYEEGEL